MQPKATDVIVDVEVDVDVDGDGDGDVADALPRVVLLTAALFSAPAFASGFAVSEQDASASGRAGTGISAAAPSAIHFNPAGLGFLAPGASAQAGATAIVPSITAVDPQANETHAETQPAVPPHVYAAWAFEKNVTLGAGFNAPFGGGVKWPRDWFGRTELTEMNLRVLAGHLGGAYRFNDSFAIGATAQLYSVTVALTRQIDFVESEGTAQLGGSGLALGAQLGLDWAPAKWVRLGLTGRIPASAQLHGRAHFENIPYAFNSKLPDQNITSQLTLPGKVALGADFDLSVVRLYVDAELTFWQSFQRFAIDFEDPNTPDVDQPRNWSPAPTFRVGAERRFGNTTVRLGGLADLAASPDDTLSPSLPDSHRLGFSLGAGHSIGSFRGDLAYQFVAFLPRASSGEALRAGYLASAHLLSLTLGYTQR
jgi:long-chain fatty acid transport protein